MKNKLKILNKKFNIALSLKNLKNLDPFLFKRKGVDFLELRVDALGKIGFKEIEKIKKANKILPVIITVRSKKEGGINYLSEKKRKEIFFETIPFVSFVDIELSSNKILKEVINYAHKYKKRVIVSYHNFKHTPQVLLLKRKIQQAVSYGADIVKIATFINQKEDILTLARLLTEPDKHLIIMGMGEMGKVTRVIFPLLGSLLTYTFYKSPTASGQLPLEKMKKIKELLI